MSGRIRTFRRTFRPVANLRELRAYALELRRAAIGFELYLYGPNGERLVDRPLERAA